MKTLTLGFDIIKQGFINGRAVTANAVPTFNFILAYRHEVNFIYDPSYSSQKQSFSTFYNLRTTLEICLFSVNRYHKVNEVNTHHRNKLVETR